MAWIHSLLHWIFGPHMFDIAAVLCIGSGIAMALSTDPKDISAAFWFFGIAAVLALGRAAHWLVTEPSPPLPKPLLAGVLFAVIGVLWITAHSWVQRKFPAALPTHKENPPAVVITPVPSVKEVPKKHLPPPPPDIRLIFKASPLFTPERKQKIELVVDEYCGYLKSIGFDIPKEFPPLGTAPGKVSARVGMYPGTIYDEEIRIGQDSIDNAVYVRAIYSAYIFDKLLNKHDPTKLDGFAFTAEQIFSVYYLSDFSNTAPSPPRKDAPADKWIGAIWEIRQTYGREFANRSLFYAFKQWNEPRDDPDKEDFDRFFGRRFRIGTTVEDNLFEHAKGIAEILENHGIKQLGSN